MSNTPATPPGGSTNDDRPPEGTGERCDYCGSDQLVWRKCKLICLTCQQINKSCADL